MSSPSPPGEVDSEASAGVGNSSRVELVLVALAGVILDCRRDGGGEKDSESAAYRVNG